MDLRQVQEGVRRTQLMPPEHDVYDGVRMMTLPSVSHTNGRRHHQHTASSSDVVAMPVQTSVIIPAHNEAASVANVVGRVRNVLGLRDEVIVVDDGSSDETAMVAEAAGARVVSRPYCFGNGSAIKTGIRAASGRTLVFLDADGQMDPHRIPKLLEELETHDMVVAARTKESQAGWQRCFANAMLNRLASRLSGRPILDLTSGFRAMRREIAAEFLPLLPNTFGYPATITLAHVKAGYSLKYLVMEFPDRAAGKSHMKPIHDFTRFISIILRMITMFAPLRVFGPVSAVPAAFGAAFVGLRAFMGIGEAMMGPLLLSVALFLFCIGLVSEQIAALRFERHASPAFPVDHGSASHVLPKAVHA